jgi:hypothetical protein
LLVVLDSSGQPKPDQANVLAQAQHHIAIQVHLFSFKPFSMLEMVILSCMSVLFESNLIHETSAGYALFLRQSHSVEDGLS